MGFWFMFCYSYIYIYIYKQWYNQYMYIVQVYCFYIPKFKTRLHFNMSRFIKVIYLLLFYWQNAHQIFEQSQFKEIIKEKHQRNFFFSATRSYIKCYTDITRLCFLCLSLWYKPGPIIYKIKHFNSLLQLYSKYLSKNNQNKINLLI